jgi:hypothetical protein
VTWLPLLPRTSLTLGLKWKTSLQSFGRDCLDRLKSALGKVLSGYKKTFNPIKNFSPMRFITWHKPHISC